MDAYELVGLLPRPKGGFVLPSHRYTGPYNPLEKQLDKYDNPLPDQKPFNAVDRISLHHDICYRDGKESKRRCDDDMLKELDKLKPKNSREKFDKNGYRYKTKTRSPTAIASVRSFENSQRRRRIADTRSFDNAGKGL